MNSALAPNAVCGHYPTRTQQKLFCRGLEYDQLRVGVKKRVWSRGGLFHNVTKLTQVKVGRSRPRGSVQINAAIPAV